MSKKAVDIDLIKIEPITYTTGTSQATLDQITGGIGGLDIAFNNQLNLNSNMSNSFLLG